MKHRFGKRFSAGTSAVFVCVVSVLATGPALAQVTIPNTFSAGSTISATEMNQNFTALKNAVDPLQVSNYTAFSGLNISSVTVNTATAGLYTKLGTGTLTFTKLRADTKLEVQVHSRFGAGTFAGGAPGIIFQARVDDVASALAQTQGAITTSGVTDFLSFFAVFPGLAAGSHTVSLWATTFIAGTSSTGVLVDPGGFFGGIVVKELF
jgi:hypothetical protein